MVNYLRLLLALGAGLHSHNLVQACQSGKILTPQDVADKFFRR